MYGAWWHLLHFCTLMYRSCTLKLVCIFCFLLMQLANCWWCLPTTDRSAMAIEVSRCHLVFLVCANCDQSWSWCVIKCPRICWWNEEMHCCSSIPVALSNCKISGREPLPLKIAHARACTPVHRENSTSCATAFMLFITYRAGFRYYRKLAHCSKLHTHLQWVIAACALFLPLIVFCFSLF